MSRVREEGVESAQEGPEGGMTLSVCTAKGHFLLSKQRGAPAKPSGLHIHVMPSPPFMHQGFIGQDFGPPQRATQHLTLIPLPHLHTDCPFLSPSFTKQRALQRTGTPHRPLRWYPNSIVVYICPI